LRADDHVEAEPNAERPELRTCFFGPPSGGILHRLRFAGLLHVIFSIVYTGFRY
jgi:hypothetical protein